MTINLKIVIETKKLKNRISDKCLLPKGKVLSISI